MAKFLENIKKAKRFNKDDKSKQKKKYIYSNVMN